MSFEFYADLIDYTRCRGIHSSSCGPARYLRLRIGTDSGQRPTDGRNRRSGSGISSVGSKAGVRYCQNHRGFPVQREELDVSAVFEKVNARALQSDRVYTPEKEPLCRSGASGGWLRGWRREDWGWPCSRSDIWLGQDGVVCTVHNSELPKFERLQ